MRKAQETLDQLRKEYEPYASFVGTELAKLDDFQDQLDNINDPAQKAFRENPVTQRLFKNCAAVYRSSRLQLANDEGNMSNDERRKLHISILWSKWFMESLGGDPTKLKEQVENEIISFATKAGVINSEEVLTSEQ